MQLNLRVLEKVRFCFIFGFRRIPDSSFRFPNSGFWIPDSGFRILDSEFWIPDSGFQFPDFRVAPLFHRLPNHQTAAFEYEEQFCFIHVTVQRVFRCKELDKHRE